MSPAAAPACPCVHNLSVTVQAEDNSFQPILPEADIAQMYNRILDTEIAVITGDKPLIKQANNNSSSQNLKLAASMGLSQLMMPFRYALSFMSFMHSLFRSRQTDRGSVFNGSATLQKYAKGQILITYSKTCMRFKVVSNKTHSPWKIVLHGSNVHVSNCKGSSLCKLHDPPPDLCAVLV